MTATHGAIGLDSACFHNSVGTRGAPYLTLLQFYSICQMWFGIPYGGSSENLSPLSMQRCEMRKLTSFHHYGAPRCGSGDRAHVSASISEL